MGMLFWSVGFALNALLFIYFEWLNVRQSFFNFINPLSEITVLLSWISSWEFWIFLVITIVGFGISYLSDKAIENKAKKNIAEEEETETVRTRREKKSFYKNPILLIIVFLIISVAVGFIGKHPVHTSTKQPNKLSLTAKQQARAKQIMQGVVQDNPDYLTPTIHTEFLTLLKGCPPSEIQLLKKSLEDQSVYMKEFYQDALVSYQKGAPYKSSQRSRMEKQLLAKDEATEDRIKSNDKIMQSIAAHQSVTENGKSVQFNESTINTALRNVDSELQRIDQLFKPGFPNYSTVTKVQSSKPTSKPKTISTTSNAPSSLSSNSRQSDIQQDIAFINTKGTRTFNGNQYQPIVNSKPDAQVDDGFGGTLYAWNIIAAGSGDGNAQQIYFFDNNHYLGTDTLKTHLASNVRASSNGTIIATYQHYLANDSMATPTGNPYIVSFHWNGNSLKPSNVQILNNAVNDQFK
jgi:hypothetical protein